MLEKFLTAYYEVMESLKREGMKGLLRKRIYRDRIATPVEMILSKAPDLADLPVIPDYKFVELTLDQVKTRQWNYAVPSRFYKAFGNLKKGWRSFAFVKDNVVIGDIWCTIPGAGHQVNHPDIAMLGIRAQAGEAYAFDMLIDPAYRGKNLAAPLQRSLQAALKAEGCPKVYGFFWDDNLPALWMHRMLKFKELPKRQVTRIFIIQSARNAGLPAAKPSNPQPGPSKQEKS